MNNRLSKKEEEIKKRLWIAIGVASGALLFTLFDLPFDFILSLVAYILVAIAVVKKDGAFGILQVILVFPAIYKGVSDFFSGGGEADYSGEEDTRKLEKLANFALFYTATIIIFTILFPIIRFIWKIFT